MLPSLKASFQSLLLKRDQLRDYLLMKSRGEVLREAPFCFKIHHLVKPLIDITCVLIRECVRTKMNFRVNR